jgi:hypothetical protein
MPPTRPEPMLITPLSVQVARTSAWKWAIFVCMSSVMDTCMHANMLLCVYAYMYVCMAFVLLFV